MDHGKNVKTEKDAAFGYKQKLGALLFFIYFIFYASFIVINLVSPKSMGIQILFGVNLAVVYGFLLIIIAIVMGLIYNKMCTDKEKQLNKEENKK